MRQHDAQDPLSEVAEPEPVDLDVMIAEHAVAPRREIALRSGATVVVDDSTDPPTATDFIPAEPIEIEGRIVERSGTTHLACQRCGRTDAAHMLRVGDLYTGESELRFGECGELDGIEVRVDTTLARKRTWATAASPRRAWRRRLRFLVGGA